jgi:raffinose/stachyose/melibiose transport system permease protein
VTSRAERLLTYVVLSAFALVVLLPILSILSVALRPPDSSDSGLTWPTHIDWSNFADAWTAGHFDQLMVNSLTVALLVVPAATVFSVLAGYAFGTMRFPGDTAIFYLLLTGIVLPYEAAVIPLYYDLRAVGLTNTYIGLALPEIGLFMAFGVFWMRAFFLSAPRALVEAARVDGAGSFTILVRVLLPLARPAITTMVILFFFWTWNEFLLALVLLQDPAMRTAPAGLGYFVGQFQSDVSGLAAGAVLVMTPVVLFFVLLNRRVISGMLSGAVKG